MEVSGIQNKAKMYEEMSEKEGNQCHLAGKERGWSKGNKHKYFLPPFKSKKYRLT